MPTATPSQTHVTAAPLENGDQLDQRRFTHAYRPCRNTGRAELIGGSFTLHPRKKVPHARHKNWWYAGCMSLPKPRRTEALFESYSPSSDLTVNRSLTPAFSFPDNGGQVYVDDDESSCSPGGLLWNQLFHPESD